MANYSPEQIREKFGLSYNEKHAGKGAPGKYSESTGGDGFATKDGAIFTESGEYVGSVKGDGDSDYYSGYSKLTDAASSIKQKHEGKGFTDVDSLSDVAGAVHWLTKGEQEAPKTEAPEEPDAPVSVSPKLAEARTRVKQYEEDVLSGRSVYGKKSFEQTESGDSFLDRYKLKLKEDYKENPKGDYVATGDQERYDADMDEYNRKKAEYDAQNSSLGN